MVTTALDDVVAALGEAGITATVDPPEIHPPGAWVAGRRLQRATLCGSYAVVIDVYLIVRDNGIKPALVELDSLLGRTLDVIDEHDWELESTTLDETVTLPSGGGPMPAYRLTIIYE